MTKSLGGILKRRSVIVSAALGLALVGGGAYAAKEVRDNITAQQLCTTLETHLKATGESVDVKAGTERAAKAKGAQYVSALDWDLEFLPDRLHLTPAGHARFASLVAAELPN
ncbi:lysophospholipase L1-like esterase [Arthrobacter ginsengisoli]|uniref:Lysophospholipase L1-like esterase n=1 Tax=Arthrobacter ginsengisoli TaxID=1356565 RepID=A0ABU1U8D1_9MICC|nr:hypothetical protein [Arthrobacter ginsengisoli]MDR7081449.1 lysophospholipase L1-like esterase [Arthrobacter ginsengisoli]